MPARPRILLVIISLFMLSVWLVGELEVARTAAADLGVVVMLFLAAWSAFGVPPAVLLGYSIAGGELVWSERGARLAVGHYIGPVWLGRTCMSAAVSQVYWTPKDALSPWVALRMLGLSRGAVVVAIDRSESIRFGSNLSRTDAEAAVDVVRGWLPSTL